MPIPPPPPAAPFDTVDSVLNLVRSKMLDTIGSLAGDILTDAQPFMQEYTNAGWRELQFFLATLGHSVFKVPFLGVGYPVVAGTDPALWTSLSWTAFINTDGTNYVPPNVTLLPFNMILPLRVSERMTGSQSRWSSMEMARDQLPATRKGIYNGWWLWENNTLYMPGSVYSMDLRMELAIYLGDFVTTGPVFWYQQPVPIARAKNALALFICDEVDKARNEPAGGFKLLAEQAARHIYNIEVSQKQRVPTQRQPYSGARGLQIW
jgi:hypothetical protein